MKTYEKIMKITTGSGDDYAAGCLLDYTYFKKYFKMIAIQSLMLIQRQYSKLIALEIQIKEKIQQCFSLLKKQKKSFQILHKDLLKYCKFISF